MSWIKEISYHEATGYLKKLYDRVKGPDNNIDNVLSIHSLRPHTLIGHMGLYKNVLHNSNNTLPKWYLETLGVYVSALNHCNYCVDHHAAGLKRLLNDDSKYNKIMGCLIKDQVQEHFKYQYLAGLEYAKKLTLAHHTITELDIHTLRKQQLSDGQILEINQVVSYFNYVNRTVGLSPNNSDDPNSWEHS